MMTSGMRQWDNKNDSIKQYAHGNYWRNLVVLELIIR